MRNTDEVAIFWDYENCPAPSNSSGYAIVDNIRSVAQTFGSVILFKAYLEVTEQFPVSRAQALRSELQSSGVSLIDCPHNGRKDVADKMILVDMLAHAIDNPAPSTIILISGDRDFAYALSILRLRRYHIVLITLSNAHPSLRAQASLSFDWTSDILESVDPTLSHQPTSPRRGKSSAPPLAAYDKFFSDPKGSRSPLDESHDEKPASSTDFINYFQDKIKSRESSPTSRSPSKHATTGHTFLPVDFEQSKRQPAAASVASSALGNEPESSVRVIYTPVASSSCPPYFNASIETSLANSSQTTLTPNTPSGSTPKPTTCGNITASRFPAHSTLRDPGSLPPLAQHGVSRVTKPVSFGPVARIVSPEPHSRKRFPSSEQQSTYFSINPKTQSSSGVDRTHLPPPSTHSYISPPPNVAPTTLLSSSTHVAPNTLLKASAPSFITPSSLHPTASAPAVPPSPIKPSTKPVPPPAQPPLLPIVPEKFKILIQCLKSHRSKGEPRPLRGTVALTIARNGTTYRQAGVTKFSEYTGLAEKAGIVELGGSEGAAWIGLKEPW